ncbi:MAG: ABC transporter ATP-binding protein, partial [Crenarchaeota archaeon]|nr:ABC transporter ATP-binding protein [Thermoproteota archaeon]
YLINKSEALEVFGDFVFTIPCHIIVVVFILIISFFYSYLVGIVYILSIIVYLINANLTNKKSYPKYELVQKNSEKLYILYDQYASNHIDFFINNYTKYPIKKLETVCDVKKKNNEKYIASNNFYGMNGILNEQMASILVIVICIYLFFYKNLSFGSVIMLTAFSDVIITSFSYLYNNYSFLKNISYHTNIINKHLERENPINNLSYVPNSNLLIDIRDLTIGYSNDKPLLKNICLNGNSSQIILIKGTSGIGKSTLFKTIANQISSINGNIIIREGTKIIYVDDEDYIFNRTLRENIDFLDPSINITDIENNMQLFLLDELICRLNDNLEENGQLISGGEKNRISLIRSVLANADLILLDEPLKSVDDAIKKKIASKLRNIFKDKCCLIITHGDVFDEYCDKILHMEDFI